MSKIGNLWVSNHVISPQKVQRKATKLVKGLRSLSYEQRLKNCTWPPWRSADWEAIS